MHLVEIHTIGRVHYMLVEGVEEARQWTDAIRSVFFDAQQQQQNQNHNGPKGDGGSPTPLQVGISLSLEVPRDDLPAACLPDSSPSPTLQ